MTRSSERTQKAQHGYRRCASEPFRHTFAILVDNFEDFLQASVGYETLDKLLTAGIIELPQVRCLTEGPS
jgi:hypothetical protein